MVKYNIPIKLTSEANKGGEHWTKSAKRHKIQKSLVKYFIGSYKPPYFPIHVTLTRFAPRPFDDDNLQTAFKYIRDAISECVTGCTVAGRADNDPRIKWEYKQEKTNDKEYFICIEISQVSSQGPSPS